jgi:aldose 1-epimerase
MAGKSDQSGVMPGAATIDLAAGDYRLRLDPALGGSVARFDWCGKALFRPQCGPTIFDVACFALVPFSNRIAHGVFRDGPRTVRLPRNFPGSDHPHPLHGFGWLNAWQCVAQTPASAVLRYRHQADAWPWDFVAEQHFALSAQGLRHTVTLRNLADCPMPGGLGLHPYFPCTAQTTYLGLHRGEWQIDDTCLPLALATVPQPADWWHGLPVASRRVDTAYTGRDGPITITWPERDLALTIEPSADLPITVVYTPAGADYFCVEPVSHATDAINRPHADDAMPWLAPGQAMHGDVWYSARALV